MWKDFPIYRQDRARFISEFGFQAPAHRKTIESVLKAGDRDPQSEVMEHHNKQVEGTERLIRFQASHYCLGGDFARFVYQGQLVQAEALKCAVEHWRRRKFKTAGALFWQLNDCWPVTSWAVVDSGLRPKAAYYYAKKFYAPLLTSFMRERDSVGLWITSDLTAGRDCTVEITLRSFEGERIWSKRGRVNVSPDRSEEVLVVPPEALDGIDTTRSYLHARVYVKGELVSENRLYFEEPKHLEIPRTRLSLRLETSRGGESVLTLRSPRLVKNLRVEVAGEDVLFDDNYFDLDPGITKAIRFRSTLPRGDIRRKLKFISLGEK